MGAVCPAKRPVEMAQAARRSNWIAMALRRQGLEMRWEFPCDAPQEGWSSP